MFFSRSDYTSFRGLTLLFWMSLICLVAAPHSAFAARAANIVEKTFILKGINADEAARALGISGKGPQSLKLPWDKRDSARNCSWGTSSGETSSAVGLCENLPLLVTTIEYVPGTPSELRLSGWWSDYTTGSGPHFARFQFSSPEIREGKDLAPDWQRVFNAKIGTLPASAGPLFPQAIIRTGESAPYFEILRWDTSYGYRKLFVTLDFDSHEQHQRKADENEKCRKQYKDMDGGPC